MAIKGFTADQFVKFFAFGLVFLWAITQIINIGAIGKDACSFKEGATVISCAVVEEEQACVQAGCQWNSILKEPEGGYESLVSQGFVWLIVAFAAILTWGFMNNFAGRWDKRTFVSIILFGIVLGVLYIYVLQPLIPGLAPKLDQAAYQLQAMSPSGLQSIFGAP